MKFEEFVKKTEKLPVIDTEILLAGVGDPRPFKVQISRWAKSGKLIQLKRGIYLLTEIYRKEDPFAMHIAALLKKPSYITFEKALEHHDIIPEAVPVYSSVTTKRQARFESPAGVFDYRHIRSSLFWGYESVTVRGQAGFIAYPEKALLDLIYFRDTGVTMTFLEGLRLQNLDGFDLVRLRDYAKRFKKPGMIRAAGLVEERVIAVRKEEKVL